MGLGAWNPEWIQAIVAFLALWAAVVAGIVSWQAYRTSYRPMLRVIPLGYHDDSGPDFLDRSRLVLKNFGRGPAFSIVIVNGRGASPDTLIGEVDALEPLGETYGPKFSESSRVGRVEVQLDVDLQDDDDYRVLYVDAAGGWHETTFKVSQAPYAELESRIAVPLQKEEVPPWVRERAQIVSSWSS